MSPYRQAIDSTDESEPVFHAFPSHKYSRIVTVIVSQSASKRGAYLEMDTSSKVTEVPALGISMTMQTGARLPVGVVRARI